MTNYTRLVADCSTGEVTEVAMTVEEIAELESLQAQLAADVQAREQAEAAKAEAKVSAEAKLSALGLTADEIAALLN